MRKFVSHYSDKIMTQDTIGRITADTTIDYGNLMRRRIRKVLLIGSSYDAFTLEEDGRIDVQISNEYIDLNLSNPPSFRRVSSSVEALELLRDDPGFDLVKGVQAWMLAPVLKIHDGTRGTVYKLCKVFLCPAFRLSLALDLPA